MTEQTHYDFIIVGSGFGGSVSALRLAEKGYSVLVLEKGRRFTQDDFPKTNWRLRKWLWKPGAGLRGIFKMTFFRHVTILSGVGVGGGSLTYANTLPVPRQGFFEAESWRSLSEDWKAELEPHYATARRMLGATKTPCVTTGDRILKEIATDMGREEHFDSNDVAVFFGEPGITVPDPYFEGKGPERAGCTFCGACMTGCRHNAKNTLDKNYLYLAEKLGVSVRPETMVHAVREKAEGGFVLETRDTFGWRKKRQTFTADRVIFSGGVLGTVELLLRMKQDPSGLPRLSDRVGESVRTNNESLIAVVTPKNDHDFTEGIAITSILHTDEHSHIEPVRYGRGSGFFRVLMMPHAPGYHVFARLWNATRNFFRRPLTWMRVLFVRDFAKHHQILLYMRALEGSMRIVLKRSILSLFRKVMATRVSEGAPPRAYIPEATEIAERFAEKIDGVTCNLLTETLMGIPTTAHILGGSCMGSSSEDGVINSRHEVFGYDGLYVIDGSAVSANPGVNPSLTITALAERAMSLIPERGEAGASAEG